MKIRDVAAPKSNQTFPEICGVRVHPCDTLAVIRWPAQMTLALLILAVPTGCTHNPRVQDFTAANNTRAEQAAAEVTESARPMVIYRDAATFPRPPELEPAVEFWRKTFAVWRRSQVAIHDDRYLDIVYEIMNFADPVAESLTTQQKNWITERRSYWKDRLASLENKVSAGLKLNADDQHLLALIRIGHKGENVLAGASERVRSQRGTKERFMKGLEISMRYEGTFRKIFREAGLPEDLAYLPHVESSFQAHARSSAGAVGIWQFTKGAAERFMPGKSSVEARQDPIASAHGAARYLSYAYTKLGNWPLAVTSYNHGINGMMRARNQLGQDFTRIVEEYGHPLFGFASRNYYAEFLAARDIASNAGQFLAASNER